MEEQQEVKPLTTPGQTDIRSIVVIGRKWFERVNGNTYFSAEIIIDGVRVHFIPFAYGYDSEYEHFAWAWIDDSGLLGDNGRRAQHGHVEDPWRYCKREGIAYHPTAIQVGRKMDLTS